MSILYKGSSLYKKDNGKKKQTICKTAVREFLMLEKICAVQCYIESTEKWQSTRIMTELRVKMTHLFHVLDSSINDREL